jgi:hypothetical protein
MHVGFHACGHVTSFFQFDFSILACSVHVFYSQPPPHAEVIRPTGAGPGRMVATTLIPYEFLQMDMLFES